MSLDSRHPLYGEFLPTWEKMRTCYAGQDAVKEAATRYLPYTPGMKLDGVGIGEYGRARYELYKDRAVYHNFLKDAVDRLLGLLHQRPPTIMLPSKMEGLITRASADGETLDALLRRINLAQLTPSRIFIMGDFDEEGLPYISVYVAESVINWDTSKLNALNLVVIEEVSLVRDGFDWTTETRYRVLQLGDLTLNEEKATYKTGIFDDSNFIESQMVTPMYYGKTLDTIPGVFINAADTLTSPSMPPLLPLVNLSLSIYKSEADYRQTLYMSGEDTLVISGDLENDVDINPDGTRDLVRTGTGTRLHLSDTGNAKYIGITGTGIAEQRQALENDKREAEDLSSKLISYDSGTDESGVAIRTRLAAQTATLNQIAKAGAEGLEKLLKIMASWMGLNPDDVSIQPNLEFTDFELEGQEFVYLMTGKSMGLPLSKESIHGLMVERGITKMAYEDELAAIEQEDNGFMTNGQDDSESADT